MADAEIVVLGHVDREYQLQIDRIAQAELHGYEYDGNVSPIGTIAALGAGGVVGFLEYGEDPLNPDVAILTRIAVTRELQGQGIGTELIETVITQVQGLGKSRAKFESDGDAVDFYIGLENLGFDQDSRERLQFSKDL